MGKSLSARETHQVREKKIGVGTLPFTKKWKMCEKLNPAARARYWEYSEDLIAQIKLWSDLDQNTQALNRAGPATPPN